MIPHSIRFYLCIYLGIYKKSITTCGIKSQDEKYRVKIFEMDIVDNKARLAGYADQLTVSRRKVV